MVRVVPDVTGLEKSFDYRVPPEWDARVRVGTMVRIELSGRRVAGWVVDVDVEPPPGVELRPLAKVSGEGPPAPVVDLCRWAAHQWFGRLRVFLKTASPPTMVAGLPDGAPRSTTAGGPVPAEVADAFSGGAVVLRQPPAADLLPVVAEAARRGNALVVVPSLDGARGLAARLRRAGAEVALLPRDWARAAAGGCVAIGGRAAAFAPLPRIDAAVVVDEHDEAHQEEGAPTWHARDVVLERARRDGAPCVLVSPIPSVAALAAGRLVVPSRRDERRGWPAVEVVDLRRTDPTKGLLTEPLTRWLRSDQRVVVVLNRKGRAALLACGQCRELARCERCGSAVSSAEGAGLERLECRRCGDSRPKVCASCGATTLKVVRAGVTGVAAGLAALVGEPVDEVTGEGADGDLPSTRVLVGTEAVLHRADRAGVVVFLDFDQELLAPRYRAAEEALVLLARAARLLGGRLEGGRLVVQTRLPRHEAVEAALRGDPSVLAEAEGQRRAELGFPPAQALAELGGAAAEELASRLRGRLGLQVLGPSDGTWLVRASDRTTLADALADVGRPKGRLRVAIDPLRL